MVKQRDFRKLDAATQAELRRVAVGLVQSGKRGLRWPQQWA